MCDGVSFRVVVFVVGGKLYLAMVRRSRWLQGCRSGRKIVVVGGWLGCRSLLWCCACGGVSFRSVVFVVRAKLYLARLSAWGGTRKGNALNCAEMAAEDYYH